MAISRATKGGVLRSMRYGWVQGGVRIRISPATQIENYFKPTCQPIWQLAVAQNTREGRVLRKLLDRLAEIRADLGSDQVFDVVGEVFPANQLERLLREMYARQTDVNKIEDRIVRDVSPDRFRAITESTLEGLAKKELNLSSMIGKSAEARERRLVPEVIEQFFVDAAPECGLRPKETAKSSHVFPSRADCIA
ncbi:MAG: hypothetical protein ABL921_31690 [Pirellula sp.]